VYLRSYNEQLLGFNEKRFLQQPWMFIPFALFILVFGPLPEELAWRGYALDALQVKWNALTSSLILGVAWTV